MEDNRQTLYCGEAEALLPKYGIKKPTRKTFIKWLTDNRLGKRVDNGWFHIDKQKFISFLEEISENG